MCLYQRTNQNTLGMISLKNINGCRRMTKIMALVEVAHENDDAGSP
jgi:hypothetical protein